MTKEYVCRVVGTFPEWAQTSCCFHIVVHQGGGSLQRTNRSAQLQDWSLQGGQVCSAFFFFFLPRWLIFMKSEICEWRGGKECWTEFERLSFNGRSSVVLCRPHTGRMHQIRVHLQYIGDYGFVGFSFGKLFIFDTDLRDALHIQNGWIFGKVPEGGGHF